MPPAPELASPPIRALGPGDLAACSALAVDRGWAPETAKWALLLETSEAFGIDAPDGVSRLAGAVVLTRWGADLASVGMMLVAARYARRGLGQALMEHLLAAAGDATVTLYATDMGRPLYEKLGFKQVRRHVGMAGWFHDPPLRLDNSKKREAQRGRRAGGPAHFVRPAGERDLPAIRAVDRAAFGADRGAILTRLPGFAERVIVLDSNGDSSGGGTGQRIAGYAAAWRNGDVTVIGPVVAPDTGAAKALITELARGARGPVRLDLDPDRADLPAWAHARGLRPVAANPMMAHGDHPAPGIPSWLHTPISVALA
jgi:predicted N-acetyltransferase YhbS